MQEYWLLLTLLVTLSIGIVAFINKVFAQRKYNPQVSALMLFFILSCYALGTACLQGFTSLEEIGYQNIFWCILWGIQCYAYSFVMMSALRYLSTSTYFIAVRLISSFILLGIGIFFFGDIISYKEVFGFILGVIAMSLLFEKQDSKTGNMKKGCFFLLLGILCLVFGHSVTKLFSLNLSQAPTLMFIAFTSATLTGCVFGWKYLSESKTYLKNMFFINLIQSFFYFIYFYFLFLVYSFGDLGISYKIQSYSPFIPIILAVIIYREKIDAKKSIGILLTALSLYFFT